MRSLSEYFLRLARCSSGSALIEMTYIVPVSIALMVGVVDFGMAFSARATLGKTVRDAARYLAALPRSALVDPATNACRTWAINNATRLITDVLPSASVTISPCPSSTCPTNPPGQDCITVSATLPRYSLIIPTGTQGGRSFLGRFIPALPTTYSLSAQHQEVQVGGP
jgi:Flp pilus assembly protein TadG